LKKKFRNILITNLSILRACCIWVVTFATTHTFAQSKAEEYQVKAVFLYNFTQFIDWPEKAFNSPDEPFIIGIMGDDPFGNYIDRMVEGESIGTHPIKIKRCHDLRSALSCHILYINSFDREWLRTILNSVSQKNILTVSDYPSFNNLGGIIRFYTEDNKIRLQINLPRSKEAELSISSKLLSVAKTH
jgi:hypothetical protein